MQLRRNRFRYSIAFLLALTALVAVTLAVFRFFDWQARCVWLLASFWVACGFVAGWTTRHSYKKGSRSFLSAGVFIAFNWLLWCLNRNALLFAQEGSTDPLLAEILERMIEAERLRFFDTVAIVFTGLIGVAAWKWDKRAMFRCGAACLLTWFIVVSTGYITACASLWQLD